MPQQPTPRSRGAVHAVHAVRGGQDDETVEPAGSGGPQDPEYGMKIDWTASMSTLAGAACLGGLLGGYAYSRRKDLASSSVRYATLCLLVVMLTAGGYVVIRQALFSTDNGRRVGIEELVVSGLTVVMSMVAFGLLSSAAPQVEEWSDSCPEWSRIATAQHETIVNLENDMQAANLMRMAISAHCMQMKENLESENIDLQMKLGEAVEHIEEECDGIKTLLDSERERHRQTEFEKTGVERELEISQDARAHAEDTIAELRSSRELLVRRIEEPGVETERLATLEQELADTERERDKAVAHSLVSDVIGKARLKDAGGHLGHVRELLQQTLRTPTTPTPDPQELANATRAIADEATRRESTLATLEQELADTRTELESVRQDHQLAAQAADVIGAAEREQHLEKVREMLQQTLRTPETPTSAKPISLFAPQRALIPTLPSR